MTMAFEPLSCSAYIFNHLKAALYKEEEEEVFILEGVVIVSVHQEILFLNHDLSI